MEIEFIEHEPTNFKDWNNLKDWVIGVIEAEGWNTGTLCYVFMDDNALLEYNIKFLDHDYFTDVITFDTSEFPMVNGDVLISVDRILDNSNNLKIKYLDEFCRVVIHGVLHLCGYKDKTSEEALRMRELEMKYLNKRSFT